MNTLSCFGIYIANGVRYKQQIMKKILAGALLVGTISFLNAQNVEGNSSKIKLGLKTSVNYFTHTGDVSDDVDYALAPQAGVYVNIPLGEHFAVQPELNFSRMGSKESHYLDAQAQDFGTYYVKQTDEIVLDYLTLPVMLKFYPVGGLNIEAGPQLGYNIYSRGISTTHTNTVNGLTKEELKTDLKDNINELEFGVNFGLGYEFKDTGVNLGARYYMGLTNVLKDNEINDEVQAANNLNVKNSGFTFGVGYSF